MDEATKQRELVKGLTLLEKAFYILRHALELDDEHDTARPEVRLALQLRDCKETLAEFVYERQRAGIKAAPDDTPSPYEGKPISLI